MNSCHDWRALQLDFDLQTRIEAHIPPQSSSLFLVNECNGDVTPVMSPKLLSRAAQVSLEFLYSPLIGCTFKENGISRGRS